ncbi:erythromycin esterase family protein [Nocardia australiensis]|uniref:erythromycin esterase family protein n=1 Tax=Nocardia australiensis TaxID=2887191 RepID=UPI001D13BE22|nr:erythromycin esterase family protein [Nocardia australiensis]
MPLQDSLAAFLAVLPARPTMLGLGEPTHSCEHFAQLRNQIVRTLVLQQGYRAVVLETDRIAALRLGDYVLGGSDDLDEVMATGFSHGFGAWQTNRELVSWLREHNDSVPGRRQVRLYGFDAPLEMAGAPSPRALLVAVADYLSAHGGHHHTDRLLDLIGADSNWTAPAALTDGNQSIGDTAAARELRTVADDFVASLRRQAPALAAATGTGEYERTLLYARTAAGLLRYHAAMADTTPSWVAAMLGTRDAIMADNLLDIHAGEQPRGPMLVFGLDLTDLQNTRDYHPKRTYERSKLAQMLFGFELDRRLRAAESTTMSVVNHPGGALDSLTPSRPPVHVRTTGQRLRGLPAGLLLQGKQAGAWPAARQSSTRPFAEAKCGVPECSECAVSPGSNQFTANWPTPHFAARAWTASADLAGIDPGFGLA